MREQEIDVVSALPESYSEFVERFEENQALPTCDLASGQGLPCPFCAAAHFTTYPIFTHQARELPHPPQFCSECKRIGQFFFENLHVQEGIIHTRFFVLQLSGPAQPKWFTPKIGWVL